MSKLIVGCGYLGSVLARRWLEAGQRVVATSRQPERLRQLQDSGLEVVRADVLNPSSLASLPEVDQMVYCVGLDRSAGADMRQVYVTGLANVLRALPGSPRIVHVSSTSVYGQGDGSLVDETSPTEPAEGSGRVVLEAEQTMWQLRPEAIILRFAGIYGSGRLIGAKMLQTGEAIPYDPEGWLNLIHVEDGATAVEAALMRGQRGHVYNISDNDPVKRRDFYGFLANLLGVEANFAPSRQDGGRRISSTRMRRELGVEPRYPSYREGLRASL